MEITNYWYDNLGSAYYKNQSGRWNHLLLDKQFFVDLDDNTKSIIFDVMKSNFGNVDKLSKHTEIITGYKNYLGNPLIGIKFDNSNQSIKPYFNSLKNLKKRNMVIYGENIFRYGILIDPDITINNSRVKTWFLDIEIDNFSNNNDISMQQVVDHALSKLISITIYDTLAKKYVALVVDPKGEINEQRTIEDNKIVKIFKTELQMIKFFVQLLRDTQPYILSGWYSNEFDIPFLINKIRNTLHDNSQMSLIDGLECDIYIKKSNNGEVQHFNKIPGIELIDYMDLYLKYSGKNPPSKSLDGVAKFEGIQGKTESKGFLNYYDDFDKFLKYIFRDVEVLVELENSKRLIKMITALQELVKIPLSQIMHTSRMVEQMIYHSTFNDNIVIPSYVKYSGNGGYQGAIVLDPEDETFDNVIVLDYASLYPNTIITFNISPDTLLKGKQLDDAKQKGIPCSDLTELMDGEKVGYRLDFMGMIPKAVKMLIDKRMEYKKLFKDAQDDDPNKVEYDLKQWNYKIIINSIYGYLGYRFSPLFDVIVSGSVTAQSRYMLTTCVDLINTSPMGANVIYGDSVQGDSNIIIKIDNKIKEIQIKDLFVNVDYKTNNKEYSNCNNIEVLTMDDNGNNVFKPIKYIMRHNTNKQMYRVQATNTNYIDVTEDHSIVTMDKDMNLCYTKPNNFDPKQYLILNNKIPYQINSRQYSKDFNIKHPKTITPIEYCDYVYDIEVENIHRFYANGILVHNTDSQFSVLNKYNHKENADKKEIEQMQNTLSKHINSQLLDRILPLFCNIEKNKIHNTLQVDVDKIFKKLRLFGVKKRYYGINLKGEEEYHGIELARSDTPQSIKPTLSDFFKKQLYGKLTKEELLEKYNEIKQLPLEDIGVPKSITQLNLSNYKVIPGHVRGMLFAKQIGINIPDVITDKLLQIPVIIYKDYNPELFNKAKEIFNLKSKKATELECIISVLPDLLEETINTIEKLDKFIQIDYFTFYDKQILEKMTQFSELRPMIEQVRTEIAQMEYKTKQGKNLLLFSIG